MCINVIPLDRKLTTESMSRNTCKGNINLKYFSDFQYNRTERDGKWSIYDAGLGVQKSLSGYKPELNSFRKTPQADHLSLYTSDCFCHLVATT